MPSQAVNEIIEKVSGCTYEFSNVLGSGFVEKVYENALVIAIRRKGLLIEQQLPINVLFDGVIVEHF